MTRNLRLALIAALCLPATMAAAEEAAPAAPSPTIAPAPSTAQPEEELEQLAEITVRGKRLLQEIADAEDDFYKIFNQVNKDDDYDTTCPNLRMESGSRITTRACIPGFVAEAIVNWQVFKAQCDPPQDGFDEFSCLDRNHDNRLSQDEFMTRPGLNIQQFMTMDQDQNNVLIRKEVEDGGGIPRGVATYQPPPPQLVLMEGSAKWAQAMKKVIDSDPRLQEKAGQLDDLYAELTRVNQRFIKVQADGLPAPTTRRELGPRAR